MQPHATTGQAAEASAPPRRVVVIGTTGSGKTTLARRLADAWGVPHVEIDALYWEPAWTPAPAEVFRERVAAAVAAPAWVADGNYRIVGDLTWGSAELLVWLDYPMRTIFWRLFRRTLVRAVRGVELWNGNRESLRKGFLSRESLFVWALRTHWRHRQQYPERLAQPEHAHLRVVRLRSPKEAERFAAKLLGG